MPEIPLTKRKQELIHPGGLYSGLSGYVGKGVPGATWEYLKDVGETAIQSVAQFKF